MATKKKVAKKATKKKAAPKRVYSQAEKAQLELRERHAAQYVRQVGGKP